MPPSWTTRLHLLGRSSSRSHLTRTLRPMKSSIFLERRLSPRLRLGVSQIRPSRGTSPLTHLLDYQLVRYHHPDSQHCRCLPGDQAHVRFQKIVAAYDYLRGATSSPHPGAKRYGFDPGHSHFDPYLHELARRRRAQRAAYANRHWGEGFGARKEDRADDFDQNGSKERTILVFGVLVSFGSCELRVGNSL